MTATQQRPMTTSDVVAALRRDMPRGTIPMDGGYRAFNQVRRAREMLGMSQADLIERSGLSRKTVIDVELHGAVGTPNDRSGMRQAIANGLGLPVEVLFYYARAAQERS